MDVARYFGLTHVPFRAVTAPEDAWLRGPFAAAVAKVQTRLRRGDPLVALVGPAGAGKSLALRTIATRLEAAGTPVHHAGRADQLVADLPAEGVLLVDEADASDPDAFRRLQDAAGRGLQVVLAGEGAFLGTVAAALRSQPIRLSPLNAAEARDFVADRLARCGNARLFAPAALDALVDVGGGSPRRIGIIAGTALLEAALDGADAVGAEHVDRARAMRATLAERSPVTPPASAGRPSAAFARLSLAGASFRAGTRRLAVARDGRVAAVIALVLGLSALPFVVPVQGQQATVSSTAEPPAPALARPTPAAPQAMSPAPVIVAQPDIPDIPDPQPAPVAAAPAPDEVLAAATPPPKPAARPNDREPPEEAPPPPRAEPRPIPVRAPPPRPAPEPAAPPEPPAQVALAGRTLPADGAAGTMPSDSSAAPDERAPTPARSTIGSEPVLCACPKGMSAARCNEWKVWNCRSKD